MKILTQHKQSNIVILSKQEVLFKREGMRQANLTKSWLFADNCSCPRGAIQDGSRSRKVVLVQKRE